MKAKNKREVDAMARRLARHVEGKTVARVELRAWEEERVGTLDECEREREGTLKPRYGRVYYAPCIVFTDGTRLVFGVDEPDMGGGSYGVTPAVVTAKGKRAR